jgi:preprotein translocase subunit SecA
VLRYAPDRSFSDNWNLQAIYDDAQASFGVVYRISEDAVESKQQNDIFDELWVLVKARYEEKEARYGAEGMRKFERAIFLMVIDNLWKDHLFEMDHLKGGVQFRAFGQKNPLYEYQREGLKMFKELRDAIAKEITSYLFRLEKVDRQPVAFTGTKTIHDSAGTFGAGSSSASSAAARQRIPAGMTANRGGESGQPMQKQPVRVGPQVGRNDPCPCGSGKKYKKCCGSDL